LRHDHRALLVDRDHRFPRDLGPDLARSQRAPAVAPPSCPLTVTKPKLRTEADVAHASALQHRNAQAAPGRRQRVREPHDARPHHPPGRKSPWSEL
jgi:hypothetical protein